MLSSTKRWTWRRLAEDNQTQLNKALELLQVAEDERDELRSEVITLEWSLSEATKAAERLRAALEKIEAGYGLRLSAAELASIARQAL